MKARYIGKSPFRTDTQKFIPGEVYDVDPITYEHLKPRFEIITEPKKKETKDGNPEQ